MQPFLERTAAFRIVYHLTGSVLFALCSPSVVLMQDGAEDKQKSKQAHAVNIGISLIGPCQEEHGAAVQPFDDKRKAESEKEGVAGCFQTSKRRYRRSPMIILCLF